MQHLDEDDKPVWDCFYFVPIINVLEQRDFTIFLMSVNSRFNALFLTHTLFLTYLKSSAKLSYKGPSKLFSV